MCCECEKCFSLEGSRVHQDILPHLWLVLASDTSQSKTPVCSCISGSAWCTLESDCMSATPDFPALFFGPLPPLRPCPFLTCPVRLYPGNRLHFLTRSAFVCPLLHFWLPGSTCGCSFPQWALPACDPLLWNNLFFFFAFGFNLLNPCMNNLPPLSCEQFSAYINKD